MLSSLAQEALYEFLHVMHACLACDNNHRMQQQPQTYNPNSIRPRSPVANQAEPPGNHRLLLLIDPKSMGLQHPPKIGGKTSLGSSFLPEKQFFRFVVVTHPTKTLVLRHGSLSMAI
jgi:hypothetical protein